MNSTSPLAILRTTALLVLLGAPTSPVLAQSESELRQQSARQAQRVEDLGAEVEALRERVRLLEALVAELTARLDAATTEGTEAPTEAPTAPKRDDAEPIREVTSRPENVFESPATVLDTLRWDFRRQLMTDPSFALGVGSNSERARLEATSILNAWVQRMNRNFRESVIWPVRLLEETPRDEDTVRFSFQALAPDGSDAGAPFEVIAPNRIARRLSGWRSQGRLERLLLKGTLEPRLTAIDPERGIDPAAEAEEAGPADTLVEVSPYVAFDYAVRLSTLLPVFAEEDGGASDGS